MSEISEAYAAYKAETEPKTTNANLPSIGKSFESYKAEVSKPPVPTTQEIKQPEMLIGPTGDPYYSDPTVLPALAKAAPAIGMIGGGMLAAPLVTGMSAIPAAAVAATAAGVGAGAGELARQGITDEEISLGEAGKTAGTAAAWESGLRGLGIGSSAVAKYVANSPRLLNAMAKTLSAFTKGEYTSHNILEAMERAGIPGAMKAVEQETEAQKFAPRGTGKMSVENVTVATKKGGTILSNVQNDLKEMRNMAGSEISKVDAELVNVARQKGENLINLKGIANDIENDILEIEVNPILSEVVNTTRIRKVLDKIQKNPSMTIEDALKTKRIISDMFEDFSNKGVMTVRESDMVQRTMSATRVKLKELIQQKAEELGVTNFKSVYKKFADFADDYDITLKPNFGSKEGMEEVEKRFIQLSNEIGRRGNVLENIKETTKLLYPTSKAGEVSKNISDLTDMMILRSIYQDIGHAPSSQVVGMIRGLVVKPAAAKLIKVGNIAEATKSIPQSTMSTAGPTAILMKGIAKEKKDHPQFTEAEAEVVAKQELAKDPKAYNK